jgi:hypothetical protein
MNSYRPVSQAGGAAPSNLWFTLEIAPRAGKYIKLDNGDNMPPNATKYTSCFFFFESKT